jgi:hypothetical protein
MPKTMMRERRGNAGAVESVESPKQAFPSFHEPLGNLAKGRRDFHIPTAPMATADGKVQNQKQVFHFPTAPNPFSQTQKPRIGAGLTPVPALTAAALRAASRKPTKGDVPQPYISGSSRIGIELQF